MAGFFGGGNNQGMSIDPSNPNYDPNNPGGTGGDPYGGGYYDPGGGYGQDPASYLGGYNNPIDASQNAIDPGSTSSPTGGPVSDVGSGVQSGPTGQQGGGSQLAQLLQGYPNLMMQAGGGQQRRAPPVPGQQTAPSWFQNPMEPNIWRQGDPSRWGGPTAMSSGSPYMPVTPQPQARARPRANVPLPQPRPAGADYDPSTDPNPAAGYGGAEDPNYYGGSASPAAGPDEAASAGLDLSTGGPGVPTPEMLQQPNFAPYNPATDPMGAGQTVGDPSAQAQPGVNIPGVSIRRENPPETSADISMTGAGPAQGVPLPQPRPPGADAPDMRGDLAGLQMAGAGRGPSNIQTDSSDPRVQQAVANITGQQANAPGGSNLPGGHVPSAAGQTTGAAPTPSPGGAELPGGHVPSSAAGEQPQATDANLPPGATSTAGGYDPATGQPYPTNQQGGMGQMNPMKMLFDMLFGGPQALMQDLASLVGQTGNQMGGYNPANDPMGAGQSQAPWLAQGQAAPQGTNPYNYPMAPQGSRFVPGRGMVDAQGNQIQGQPGTQSGAPARAGSPATNLPQSSSPTLGKTPEFTPRSNQGLTNEVAANTPVTPAAGAPGSTPQGAAPMSQAGAYSIPAGTMSARMGATGRPSQASVDVRPLAQEASNDQLAYQAAQMVDQEVTVGSGPVSTRAQIAQLETARNRALYGIQGNGRFPDGTRAPRSMAESLQMVGQPHGYYPNYRGHRLSPMQFMRFKQQVWDPVMRQGVNTNDIGWGPMTGNASNDPRMGERGMVAKHHLNKGMLGYHLNGGDTYFREHVGQGHGLPTMPGTGTAQQFGEGLNLPPTASPRQALANQAYERMPRWGQGMYGQFRRSGDIEDRRGEGPGAEVAREIDQARGQQPGRAPMRGGYSDDPNDPMAAALGFNNLGPSGPRRSRVRQTMGQ